MAEPLMQLVDSYADDPYGLTTDHWLRISQALRLAVELVEKVKAYKENFPMTDPDYFGQRHSLFYAHVPCNYGEDMDDALLAFCRAVEGEP